MLSDPTVQRSDDSTVNAVNVTVEGTPPCTKRKQADTSVNRQHNRHVYPSHIYIHFRFVIESSCA